MFYNDKKHNRYKRGCDMPFKKNLFEVEEYCDL